MTGLTSFGSNLIATPLVSFVFDARESILIGCVGAFFIFVALTLFYLRKVAWRDTLALAPGAFAGIPAGAWFLKSAGAKSLLLAAASALILFLLWQICSGFLRKKEKAVNALWAAPLGLISGVMMGAVGMGGPPLVVYIFLRKYDKEQTIATINAVSVVIMLGVLPWQYFSGLYTADIGRLGVLGGAFGVAGVALSVPFIKKINIALFRRSLLAMLTLSAVILFWRGL